MLGGGDAVSGCAAHAAERLNVLFITLDDMNWDSVGVFGGPVGDATPNIDRLASEGMRFEHAHVHDCHLPADAGGLDDGAVSA